MQQASRIPDDSPLKDSYEDYHSCSWLPLEELLAFNYDAQFEDRRDAFLFGRDD